MENEQTTIFTPLADEAFLSLGAQEIAYVKAINLPDGAHAIGIFSADGKPMAAAPSIEVAQALDPPARSRAGAGSLRFARSSRSESLSAAPAGERAGPIAKQWEGEVVSQQE